MKQNAIKKKLVTFILILALAVMTVAGSVMAEETLQPKNIKVALIPEYGLDSNWWHMNQETGEFEGYVIDLFQAIEEVEEGLTFTFEAFPVFHDNDAMIEPGADVRAAEAGSDIAISSWWPFYHADEEHPEDICYLAFDKPWLLLKYVYVTSDPEAPEVTCLADLADTEISIHKYSYAWMGVDDYNQANPEHPISCVFSNESEIISKLVSGECDDAILQSYNILDTDDLSSLSSLRYFSLSELDENYYCQGFTFGYRIDEPELNSRICEDLDKLAEEGVLSELSVKYFGMDLSAPAGDYEDVFGDEERYTELLNEYMETLFGDSSGTDSTGGEAAAQEDDSAGEEATVQEGDSTGDSAEVSADDAAGDSATDATADSSGDSAADATADSSGDSAGTPAPVYTDYATVYGVQEALNAAGFNCGTPDGSKGNMTDQAIIQYKAANGLDAGNADITDELLIKLGLK